MYIICRTIEDIFFFEMLASEPRNLSERHKIWLFDQFLKKRIFFNSSNNYTVVNGLQLDMKPAIGSLSVKEIQIERNDNAEGTLQFTEEAVQFTGMVNS